MSIGRIPLITAIYTRGEYPTVTPPPPAPPATAWNPADKNASVTLSNVDRTATAAPAAGWIGVRAARSQNALIRYYELLWNHPFDTGSSGYFMLGVGTAAATLNSYMGSSAVAWAWQPTQQKRWNNNASVAYGPGLGLAASSVLGVLMNFTAGQLTFYYNGASQGVAYAGLAGTLFPMVSVFNGMDVTARFASTEWTNAPGVGETEW